MYKFSVAPVCVGILISSSYNTIHLTIIKSDE